MTTIRRSVGLALVLVAAACTRQAEPVSAPASPSGTAPAAVSTTAAPTPAQADEPAHATSSAVPGPHGTQGAHGFHGMPAASMPPGDRVEGLRVARRVGCTGCHGRDGRGKELWSEPREYIVRSANLTEHAAHYDDAGVLALLRQGRTHAGQPPFGMPIFMLQRLSDREIADVTAWLRSLPPVPNPALKRTWMAPAVARKVADGSYPVDDHRPDPGVPTLGAPPAEPLALGRHLAYTSCTECHGRDLNGWGGPDDAPSLIVAKAYTPDAFKTLLRTGRTIAGTDTKTGFMSEVARERFAPLRDDEIAALKAYLDSR